jgi:hypothetical protein
MRDIGSVVDAARPDWHAKKMTGPASGKRPNRLQKSHLDA